MSMDIQNPNAQYLKDGEARQARNRKLVGEMRQTRRHGPVRIVKRGVNPNPDPLPEGGLGIERRKRG